MRKLITTIVIFAAISSLAACGKKGDVKPPRDHSSTTEQTG